MVSAPPACPLCRASRATPHHRGRARAFWRCHRCALVFVAREDYPDSATEKARYDQHHNDPSDPGYRRFLSALAVPLLDRIAPGARGLDFGCGPGPALAHMLREAGMIVDLYDVFYAPDAAVWDRRYDFITASEVIEHLHDPARELDRLFGALVPGGWLAVMTRWVSSIGPFDGSRYARDVTHVGFYDTVTFDWIATQWGATLELPATDVAILRTPLRCSVVADGEMR